MVETVVDLNPEIIDATVSGRVEVVSVSETATQITILDAAIQECGIDDDHGFQSFDRQHLLQQDIVVVGKMTLIWSSSIFLDN